MFRRSKKPDERIYGDYEDKFDPDYPLPEKKKSLFERLSMLSYGVVALSLFCLAFVLLTVSLIIAIASSGTAGVYVGAMGLIAFIACVVGVLVTLYGHFAVQIEGRIKWLAALIPNAALALLLLVLYILGLTA